MMIIVGLFKKFYGETLKIAVHLINNSPSLANEFMTPNHKWTRHQLDSKNLKAFGHVAYAPIKDDKLGPI